MQCLNWGERGGMALHHFLTPKQKRLITFPKEIHTLNCENNLTLPQFTNFLIQALTIYKCAQPDEITWVTPRRVPNESREKSLSWHPFFIAQYDSKCSNLYQRLLNNFIRPIKCKMRFLNFDLELRSEVNERKLQELCHSTENVQNSICVFSHIFICLNYLWQQKNCSKNVILKEGLHRLSNNSIQIKLRGGNNYWSYKYCWCIQCCWL